MQKVTNKEIAKDQFAKKLFWIDNLRVIALISVIILHVSSFILETYGSISIFTWQLGNILDSSIRFCVPIFVMLTGSLILPKKYELAIFFKKRFFRVVIPFIFYSLVYISFDLTLMAFNGDKMSLFETAKFIFLQFRDGSAFHLWYIYMIIGIYLFIPIIGGWIRNSSLKEIEYFLIIWLITLFFNFTYIKKIEPNFDLTYFSGYIGYLVLGYYLTIKQFQNLKKTRLIAILLGIIGVFITILGTYLGTYYSSQFYNGFYNYLTPNVMLISIGMFLYFKNRKDYKPYWLIKFRDFINKYCLGIFLIHVLILNLLAKIGIDWKFINPLIGVPLTTFMVLMISGGIVYIINKIPYGNYISG